jgi:hypothetical protein
MIDRSELVRGAREDLGFLSNANKAPRERWVVDQWLTATDATNLSVEPGPDPPDLVVGGIGVEVVEVVERGRKRGHEYGQRLALARDGVIGIRWRTPLHTVRAHGHEWVLDVIRAKAAKYGASSAAWALLVYVDLPWADRISWTTVREVVRTEAPHFLTIDAVYHVEGGVAASRLFRR